MICEHILLITFLNKLSSFFFQLNDRTFCFVTVTISYQSFVRTQLKCQTVLFDPYIVPYEMLTVWARVDQGAMVMKGYFMFPKAS